MGASQFCCDDANSWVAVNNYHILNNLFTNDQLYAFYRALVPTINLPVGAHLADLMVYAWQNNLSP